MSESLPLEDISFPSSASTSIPSIQHSPDHLGPMTSTPTKPVGDDSDCVVSTWSEESVAAPCFLPLSNSAIKVSALHADSSSGVTIGDDDEQHSLIPRYLSIQYVINPRLLHNLLPGQHIRMLLLFLFYSGLPRVTGYALVISLPGGCLACVSQPSLIPSLAFHRFQYGKAVRAWYFFLYEHKVIPRKSVEQNRQCFAYCSTDYTLNALTVVCTYVCCSGLCAPQ